MTPTPLELAREVVAGWHDRLIGDIALIIAEAEARGRAVLLEQFLECARYDALMEGPKFMGWNRSALDRLRVKCEQEQRALADPSPAVKE